MVQNTLFRTFGTMLDCSRNAVPNLQSLKKWIDVTSSLGYNTLLLYTEDTYEVPGEPYFGYMRGRYTQAELRELDAYAISRGMTLMPCIQTLAHVNALKHWPEYENHFDTEDILLAEDERVYILIEHIFQSLAASFSCRTVHLGMDEAKMIGRGRYYDIHGDSNRSQILLSHLRKVCAIGEKYGFRFIMWADMFFSLAKDGQIDDSVRKGIPENVALVYWDYYSTDKKHYDRRIEEHQNLKQDCWYAGGQWKWMGYAPHNGYSMNTTKAALASCRDHGVQDIFFTMWADDGGDCSPFTLLPSLFYASELAKGNEDDANIKKKFEQRFGVTFDSFMQLDLLGTRNGVPDATPNLDKRFLYNDPFMGIMDKIVVSGDGVQFGDCAKKLESLEHVSEYGYLFQTLGALCRLLEVKAELGVRVHAAYRSGDRATLNELVSLFDETLARLERFHAIYRTQWMLENKPHGFDVQDIRLGGLMQRLKTCRMRLADYCDGKLERIAELEEEQLDSPLFWDWGIIATTNVVLSV